MVHSIIGSGCRTSLTASHVNSKDKTTASIIKSTSSQK